MEKKQRPITGVYTFRTDVQSPTGGALRVALRGLRRVKHLGDGRFEVIAEKDGSKTRHVIVGGHKARAYVDKLVEFGYVRS